MFTRWKILSHLFRPVQQHFEGANRFTYLFYTTITVLCISSIFLVSFKCASAQERQISSQAMNQMRTLLNEKAARTANQKKISSGLLLSSMRRRDEERIRNVMRDVPKLRTYIKIMDDDSTLVDIKATKTETLISQIKTLGGSVINSHPKYQAVRARIPINQLEKLAESLDVKSIREADLYQIHKDDTSEGDRAHKADIARTTFEVDGSGVKIGIISDSVEALSNLQNSGDLPAVTVLPGQASSGTSEGTAMLEIIHDLAPGAELFFATANGGQAQFARNILDLQNAGCDIIVDDVGYFAEPVFQDGIIAQAVNSVIDAGAQYYSSAGNSGNLNDGTSGVWEGDFVPTSAPSVLSGIGDAHNFGGGTNFNRITRDSPSVFSLNWSDPQGSSSNDYDLFLLNSDLTAVLASSTNTQDGNDDPYEQIASISNNSNINDVNNVLVIIRNPGAQSRYLHLNTNRGRLTNSTTGQTSGHSAAEKAFSVAAVNVATAGSSIFVGGMQNPVETFSSDGPRRIFYMHGGTAITAGNFTSTGGILRQKPDITAADGVSTATPGFATFFGTSASAPHAAAIGALLLDKKPMLTPEDVRNIYSTTSLDIEAPGVDRDSGFGIIMADKAIEAVSTPTPPIGEVVSIPVFQPLPPPTTGEIDVPGDKDLYSFNILENGSYIIETAGTIDTYISLFGPNSQDGPPIKENDDIGGRNLSSRITTSLVPGTYYVEVRHYSTGVGPYSISVLRVSTP